MTKKQFQRIHDWFWYHPDTEAAYELYLKGYNEWMCNLSKGDQQTMILLVWHSMGCPKV